jgi:hypothetical protein
MRTLGGAIFGGMGDADAVTHHARLPFQYRSSIRPAGCRLRLAGRRPEVQLCKELK